MKILIRSITTVLPVLVLLSPITAAGTEIDLKSDTFIHLYQLDQSAGDTADYAPLYEYISLDLTDIGTQNLSFHISGAGHYDLGEETGSGSNGFFSTAYTRYRYAGGRGDLRLGRIFMTEGIFMEALDGIHIKHSLGMFGLALFGGSPNHDSGSEDKRGDLVLGARTFVLSPGRLELGLNYLSENGDFLGDEREEAGTDLWLHPTRTLTLTGRTQYNISTSGLASDYLSLRVRPTPATEVILDTSGYHYEHLFHAATNPVFAGTLLDPGDEVRVTSGTVRWNPVERIGLYGTYSTLNHTLDDPGDTNRSEIGLDLSFPSSLERIGLRAAAQKGDAAENGFGELRSFALVRNGPFRFSLDALALQYEEKISGEDQTLQFTGSAGWVPAEKLSISGDLRMTKSPVLQEDIAVVLRVHYGY